MSDKTVNGFFTDAFHDMAESAKAQHKVDKANFAAVKAESKADFAEAKANSNPKVLQAAMQAEREEQIAAANARTIAAQERMYAAHSHTSK